VWTASPQIAAVVTDGKKPPTVSVDRRPPRREKIPGPYL
jgi:hypothetical protein